MNYIKLSLFRQTLKQRRQRNILIASCASITGVLIALAVALPIQLLKHDATTTKSTSEFKYRS